MTNLYSKILRNTLSNTGLRILSIVLGLILLPAMIDAVGESHYGLLVLTGTILGYFELLNAGLPGGTIKFVALSEAPDDPAGDDDPSKTLIDAMLTAFALSMGNQRLAVLNIEAYKLAYVLMAFAGFEMLFSGFASGLMSLTAVVLAWMLIRGMWRPKLLIDRIRLFFIDRRLARRRKGLKVVQGGKGKGDRTLHRDWSPA